MTPLEKVNSMKMPFAELKGVTFTEAGKDRVVARMLVRPDLCTLNHTIHGGAIMAFADSVGAAATIINLPDDAKGTTTIESKTNFIGGGGQVTDHGWVELDDASRETQQQLNAPAKEVPAFVRALQEKQKTILAAAAARTKNIRLSSAVSFVSA